MTVDRGPQVLNEGEECPSSEAFLAVDLTFNDDGAVDQIEARVG